MCRSIVNSEAVGSGEGESHVHSLLHGDFGCCRCGGRGVHVGFYGLAEDRVGGTAVFGIIDACIARDMEDQSIA